MKFAQRVVWVSVALFMPVLGAPLSSLAAPTGHKATIEDVKKETREFLQVLKAYSAAQRDEAIQKSKEVLADLDSHIEALEVEIDENWESMSKTARTEAHARLKELRKQRNAVAEEYGRLRESSAEGWEQMKNGFAEAYEDLHEAWERTKKEFGSDK